MRKFIAEQKKRRNALGNEISLHVMLIPPVIFLAIFGYGPLFGLVMAFQDYNPAFGIQGSKWIGLDNYKLLLALPETVRVLRNTVFISLMKIVSLIVVPVFFALLLNEIRNKTYLRTVQTIVYLPHFLSWVILGGILIDILSPRYGFVNIFLKKLGIEPIFFLGDAGWFPYTMVITAVWKNFGYDTIVYLAALSNIDPTLYEASMMDGANRIRQTWHITLPGILPIIILMTSLSIGNIFNAGFEQIFMLYSPLVYKTGDILDTLVYRIGLVNFQYGLATAVGLFKSLVSAVFIVASYKIADKFAGYKIF